MYKYEKVEHDNELPTKLFDFFVENNENQYIDKHWHRSIEILIPLYGSFELWKNGDKTIINQGNIYIINTQEIHAIRGIKKKKIYKGYALQIDYNWLKTIYPNIDNRYFIQPNKITNKKILSTIIEIIKDYDNIDEFNYIKISSNILLLVYLLLDSISIERNETLTIKDGKHKKRITKIIEYIDTNYAENLMINEIAEEFKISQGYLSKLFKDNLGITAKEYLNKTRLWHCEEQLVSTEYPVIDIAMQNGFPNVKSFNNAFKNKNGITPAVFRKKMKK